MAVGFHIELGYISGYGFDGRDDAAWQEVERIINTVRNDGALISTYIVGKTKATYDGYPLSDFVNVYDESTLLSPVMPYAEGQGYMVLCSGGGASREAKELVARAFIRAVMTECHKQGIDISVTVA